MAEVGYASLGIIPSFRNFGRELESGTSKHMAAAGQLGGTQFGDSAGRAAGSRFSASVKRFGKIAAVGLAGVAAGAFKIGADAVEVASAIDESTNKLGQVFGKSAAEITRYTGEAADAIGQSDLQARNAAATFGIFGKAAKLSNRQNAKFAKQMTTLASDLASFHDASPEETIAALGSALRGEAEPMRKYGVLLDEAALKAEALALGILEPLKDEGKIKQLRVDMIKQQQEYNEAIGEFGPKSLEAREAQADLEYLHGRLEKAMEGTVGTLTQEQKILAARSVIMKQTADAQGDFARTSDGLANQQRQLTAKWEDAKIALGQALLPAVTEVVNFLNDRGVPAFERFSDWFVDTGIPAIRDFGGFVSDEVVPPLKKAGEFAGDLIGWLKDLPSPGKIAALGGVLGGLGLLKVRGGGLGKGGALGTIGQVAGIAKPIKTFETNPLALGKGGPGGAVGGNKVPPVVAPNGSTLAKSSKWMKWAPLLPAAGALGNDQLPELMSDKAVKDWERYHANIDRATNFWTNHNDILRDGTIPMVDATHEKFADLFGATKKVDESDPKINLFLDGYGDLVAKLKKLEGDLNWVARPRYIRMTVTRDFAEDGMQTRGGLQETTEGRRPAGDTFVHNGDIVAPQPRDYERWRRNRKRALAGGGVGGLD